MLATREHEITSHIYEQRPQIVVIYDDDFNYLTKMCLTRMRDAAFSMATLAKRKGCTVIVHSSDSVDHLEEYFAHSADYVICGEGEGTLVETVNLLLKKDRAIESIKGLAYIKDGKVCRNPDRPVIKDLDILSFPAWDLVDIQRYRALWIKNHGYFSMNLVTTRGCPFHCNWCAKPIYGQVYNSRSPGNVVDEMKCLKDSFGPDHIWFCDDIFGLKPGWVEAFREEVVKKDAVIPFKCLARVDLLLKEETIVNLRKAGCTTVWVGAESGSQKILNAMEKGTTVEQIYEASRMLKDAHIRVGFFLQYGYTGETREDIDLTLKMVKECLPDEIGVSVSYPLPGTKFYDMVKSQMQGKHNWTDSQDLAMMFAGTYRTDFYRVLHRITHKRFRIAQGKEILKRSWASPRSVNTPSLRGVVAGIYHQLTLPRLERKMAELAAGLGSPTQTT